MFEGACARVCVNSNVLRRVALRCIALRVPTRALSLSSHPTLSRGFHLMRNNITTSCCARRRRERTSRSLSLSLRSEKRTRVYADFPDEERTHIERVLVVGLKWHTDFKNRKMKERERGGQSSKRVKQPCYNV